MKVLGNYILRAYDAALELNAVIIELFICGIISLTFPLFAPPFHPLFRSLRLSPPFISFFPSTSFHISRPFDVLSLFAIFHTFPRRVFHVTPTAHLFAIFTTRLARRYRDEADEATHTPVNFWFLPVVKKSYRSMWPGRNRGRCQFSHLPTNVTYFNNKWH